MDKVSETGVRTAFTPVRANNVQDFACFSFGWDLEMTTVRSSDVPGGTNSRVSDKTEPGRGLFD